MTTDPVSQTRIDSPGKAALWSGRVLSGLIAALVLLGGVMSLLALPDVVENTVKSGYPAAAVRPIGALAVASALLFLIPQTAVLGAILLTAYFGGAVATHVQLSDSMWPIAVVFGVLTWVALYLRDPRVRALAPIRQLG